MGLKKGNTNNLNGRPKGSKNKVTRELRELITDFLEANFEKVSRDLLKLRPKDRVKAFTELLQYGIPKLQATALGINFEQLSDEQLDEIINRLMNANKEPEEFLIK
jgi:vacuolar-type H+-ATPase subunit E/Vma4